MSAPEPLSGGLATETSPIRVRRQWDAIAGRLQPGPSKPMRLRWAGGALVLCTLVGAWFLFRLGPLNLPALVEGTVVESGASGARSVTLADGTQLVLSAGSRLQFVALQPKQVEVSIERGGVEFDVTHVNGRRFGVRAGEVRILVVGTRFRVQVVENSPSQPVRVSVERGAVDVIVDGDGSGPLRVAAGEAWPLPLTVDSTRTEARRVEDRADAQAPAAVEPAGSGTPFHPSTKSHEPPLGEPEQGAKELFEAGERARSAGQLAAAAAAFDELRRRFRRDGRAGLAAFELGRLELEQLSRPANAARAFRDAIALAPTAPFREDAEARLVQALEASGEQSACAKAKQGYLARYPHGAHAAIVVERCRGD